MKTGRIDPLLAVLAVLFFGAALANGLTLGVAWRQLHVVTRERDGCREVLGLLERPAVSPAAQPPRQYIHGTRSYQDVEQ